MIIIFLSIVCSTLIILTFKVFQRHEINLLQAIVANYFSCVALGWYPMTQQMDVGTYMFSEPWFPFAALMGFLFITIFFLIGLTTQKVGVTAATVAMRLTIIFPIVFAFAFYGETITPLKLIGICLALVAVVMISIKKQNGALNLEEQPKWLLSLPFIIFFGSGTIDVIVQYVEKTYFSNGSFEAFIIFVFGTAGVLGMLMMLVMAALGKVKLHGKSWIGGLILGIPNYGSMYFFFRALNLPNWESSVIFPINNIGIITMASLAAVLIFKERLSRLNYIGLICAISAFLFIYFGRGAVV